MKIANKKLLVVLMSVPVSCFHLEDAGSIGGPPRVQQVVLPRAHKPLPWRHTNTHNLTMTDQQATLSQDFEYS